jgi:hypothetical protein
MCGRTFSTLNLDPEAPKNPTIEWCFYDGRYCEEGFSLVIEILKNGGDPTNITDITHDLYVHFHECTGCRCAAFSPESWKKFKEQEYPLQ